MLQRVLIVYIAGILLCDFLLGLGPWQEKPHGQDARVHSEQVRSAMLSAFSEARLDSQTMALGMGMLLGDRQLFEQEQIQSMRQAGMSHLLAVSGLHIGILWLLFSVLLRPLVFVGRGWHRLFILLLLWGYIAVVGFPPSAVRAGVMITMLHLAWFLKREVWDWHNLCSSALLILLFQPSQIYDVGFQLSFLATAGILTARPWLTQSCPRVLSPSTGREEVRWYMRLLWYFRQLLILSVSAQFFTFPWVAYYFHHVPVFGWVQGFLVVPVIALFVYLLLALLFLSCLGLPVVWLVSIIRFLAHWIDTVAHLTVRLETLCIGGQLAWYPNLLETLCLSAALAIVAYLALRKE